MTSEILNLDLQCAKKGQFELGDVQPKDFENYIQKSLGVLQEDGPFAFAFYLDSLKQKEVAEKIENQSKSLLKDIGVVQENKALKDAIADIASDLDQLFLVKNVLEKMLVYARYHAKAQQKND